MRRLVALLALLALVPFAVAACGGDDDDGVPPPPEPEAEEPAPEPEAETVQVTADPGGAFAFEEESLEAPAGEVTFEFENPATLEHDLVIEDADGNEVGRTDLISEGSDSVTVDLEPGQYTFYCSVPGHREGGMVGPVAVNGAPAEPEDAAPAPDEPEDTTVPGY